MALGESLSRPRLLGLHLSIVLLRQLLLGLGVFAGLACAIDEHQTPMTVDDAE